MFDICLENINYEVILTQLQITMGMMKFNLIIEFCKQLDDIHQEIGKTNMNQILVDLNIEQIHIYDRTGQNVRRDEVYQLLIRLKECKMKKLILNGMSNKVVESLLGSISLFNDTFSFMI